MDEIDVVVPCYNYARFLPACVESVLNQEGVRVRVLIIDDKSSDDSAMVGLQLARQDPRVTLRQHERNQGNIATYNEGIAWASAEYFLLLSADDMLLPGALSRATSVLKAHSDAVLCHGKVRVAYEGGPSLAVADPPLRRGFTKLSGQQFREHAARGSAASPVWTPTAVVPTAAQKAAGGYNSNLPHSADLELWLRLSRLGSIVELDSEQAIYRRHGSNMHYRYRGLSNLREARLAFESALSGWSDADPAARALERTYRRGLALGAIRVANHAINEQDEPTIGEAIAFSQEMDPTVRGTVAWSMMRCRRAVGPRALRWLRRGLDPLRRVLPSP